MANVYSERCPAREVLDRIADRWTVLVLGALADGPLRYGELRRRVEGVSEKMLTQTLRSLERDGLVVRHADEETPPAVDYALTELGASLEAPMAAVRGWAEQRIVEVQEAREAYDDRQGLPDLSA
ncbi:HxlR family transcriptional regulator [Luteipulveratus mongoliensis]|uniref:HxlR family transcriptional regulator n=1 Tax=Luteipulveratus mongoliensis TaxID=571913 RepID=A0A0K1JPL0_9MICO|nr:HxlR family transcriptional regulator [Luteipulveratus mongoliensis]